MRVAWNMSCRKQRLNELEASMNTQARSSEKAFAATALWTSYTTASNPDGSPALTWRGLMYCRMAG